MANEFRDENGDWLEYDGPMRVGDTAFFVQPDEIYGGAWRVTKIDGEWATVESKIKGRTAQVAKSALKVAR